MSPCSASIIEKYKVVLATYLTSKRNPEIMVDGGFSVTHLINYCLQMNNSKNNKFCFF